MLLSHYLASATGRVVLQKATAVVELGAGGTGLPSLVAAAYAQKVVATDGNGDVVLDLLQQNVSEFRQKQPTCLTTARQLVWGNREHVQQVLAEAGG